jgi:AcrR family transcriptional regulator
MNNLSKDERIKQQIREAARSLFQKWGLQKTTMEDIAKAAEKGKSTLYYYFKSKDEIFDEIVSEEFNAILLKAQAAMVSQKTSEGKLRAFLSSTVNEARQRATIYEIVFGEISKLESAVAKLRKIQTERELEIISGILADGVRSGELKLLNEQDTHHLATLLMLTFRTVMFEYAFKNAFDEANEMIDLAITIFMGGLKS